MFKCKHPSHILKGASQSALCFSVSGTKIHKKMVCVLPYSVAVKTYRTCAAMDDKLATVQCLSLTAVDL